MIYAYIYLKVETLITHPLDMVFKYFNKLVKFTGQSNDHKMSYLVNNVEKDNMRVTGSNICFMCENINIAEILVKVYRGFNRC